MIYDRNGYPAGWAKCLCGAPVIDGHLTCGQSSCSEADSRQAEVRRHQIAEICRIFSVPVDQVRARAAARRAAVDHVFDQQLGHFAAWIHAIETEIAARKLPPEDKPSLPMDWLKAAQESRAGELEAAIARFRECGVEMERFSVEEHGDVTVLCVDCVPRFSWRMSHGLQDIPENSPDYRRAWRQAIDTMLKTAR